MGISEPQVAVDPLGNTTVVWVLGSQGGVIIQSATSVNGRAYAARVVRVRGGRASITLRCESPGRDAAVLLEKQRARATGAGVPAPVASRHCIAAACLSLVDPR